MADQSIQVADMTAFCLEQFPEGSEYFTWMDRTGVLNDFIESGSKVPFRGTPEGRGWFFPYHSAGSANPMVPYSASQRNIGFATPGKQTTGRLTYQQVVHTQAIELEGDVFANVKGGDGAIVDGFMFQMQNQQRDAQKEQNRLLHGDGSGLIAQPTAFGNGSITVATTDMKRTNVNTEFVVRLKATPGLLSPMVLGTAGLITAKNTDTGVLTVTDEDGGALDFSGFAGDAADYGIYRYDGQGNSIFGLDIFCNSASNPGTWGNAAAHLGGLDVAGEPLWGAYVNDVSGAQLDIQAHLQPTLDMMRSRGNEFLRAGSDGITWLVPCGYQNFRILENALTTGTRFIGQRKELVKNDYKYEGIMYEGAYFVIDDDAPPAHLRFAALADLRRIVVEPWNWINRMGSMWVQRNSNDARPSDFYRATMMIRHQMVAVRRCTMGQITNTNATS